MPTRPKSHSELLGRGSSDAEYDRRRWESGRDETRDEVSVDDDPPRVSLSMAQQLRHAKRWAKCRQIILARDPLCRDPYGWHKTDGRVVLAEQVDHILPQRSDRKASCRERV